MAKVKSTLGRAGYVFFKELGGAPERTSLSKTASLLVDRGFVRGRVLDYGCGMGFDADQLGWCSFDPYYRPRRPEGVFDTIVVNHVVNILTRGSREALFAEIRNLLADDGVAYISVARNIPTAGKAGPRKRIQNYVVLTLPTVFADNEEEIYRMEKKAPFEDRTREYEKLV